MDKIDGERDGHDVVRPARAIHPSITGHVEHVPVDLYCVSVARAKQIADETERRLRERLRRGVYVFLRLSRNGER